MSIKLNRFKNVLVVSALFFPWVNAAVAADPAGTIPPLAREEVEQGEDQVGDESDIDGSDYDDDYDDEERDTQEFRVASGNIAYSASGRSFPDDTALDEVEDFGVSVGGNDQPTGQIAVNLGALSLGGDPIVDIEAERYSLEQAHAFPVIVAEGLALLNQSPPAYTAAAEFLKNHLVPDDSLDNPTIWHWLCSSNYILETMQLLSRTLAQLNDKNVLSIDPKLLSDSEDAVKNAEEYEVDEKLLPGDMLEYGMALNPPGGISTNEARNLLKANYVLALNIFKGFAEETSQRFTAELLRNPIADDDEDQGGSEEADNSAEDPYPND